MAQHDMNIANQGFPAFRSDLNNALSAIQTNHSGTSRPTVQ
jgi:UDP-N-acetylglucosamine enolpyruvyl transferase